MAKKGKITIYAADFPALVYVADKLGIELLEKSQIGIEINVGIKFRDHTHIFKLGENVAMMRGKDIPKDKPQTGGAVKTPKNNK